MNHWPQYLTLGFMLLGTAATYALDGQPRSGCHSAFLTLICNAIATWVLLEGGFFAPIGWGP